MATGTAKLPTWYRALAVVVGLITIVLGIVVLAFPGLALLTLVFLLAFALLVIGIDRLIAGITGHPFGWMGPIMSGPLGGGAPTQAPGTPPSKP